MLESTRVLDSRAHSGQNRTYTRVILEGEETMATQREPDAKVEALKVELDQLTLHHLANGGGYVTGEVMVADGGLVFH